MGRRAAAPRRAATRSARGPTRTRAGDRQNEALRQLTDARQRKREAEAEIARLTPRVAAMEPPTFPIPRGGIKKFRGATYSTWFKAAGAFEAKNIGESPKLLDEEFVGLDEFDLPAVFYSQAITGKVRWFGIVDREFIIDDLNTKAPWQGNDFRDIYPAWEYTYRIVESLGGVPVRFYVHKAKQPRSAKDIRAGWKAN